jgi:hypothetical protein
MGKYGSDSHVVYHDRPAERDMAYRLRDLVRPPVVRQVS